MRSLAVGLLVLAVLILYLALIMAIGKVAGAGTMTASCYGSESGPVTASGEAFVPSGHTAASRTLPFGTRLLVRRGSRSVAVSVDDRGPYIEGRDLDLSMGACQAIGLDKEGVGPVEVEQVESGGSEKLPRTGGPR